MRIDWSFGPGRHPVIGAFNAGVATFHLTLGAWVVDRQFGWADVPEWWPLAGGAVVAVASMVSAVWQRFPGRAVAYRAACWVGAGVWSTCTLVFSVPWSLWPAITLVTATAVAAVIGTGLAQLEPQEPPPPPAEPTPKTAEDKIAVREEALLRRITGREVTVVGVKIWDPPTGHTLHVALPPDGTTVGDIKACEAQLAAALNLPPGCNVEVLASSTGRRECLIRVATENAMAETHHLGSGNNGELLPKDVAPQSVENRLAVGLHADRTLASINLRYACLVLVGQTDSGKSNTLNGITLEVGRCTDALIWAIDLSGKGRYPRPWVRPWVEGRAVAPVIDWVANTPEYAELMCLAAIQIIDGRTSAYERLMHEQNTDKIPVSQDLPEIIIVTDEMGKLSGSVKDLLKTISDTGRGAAVRLASCALEATAAYIPRPMITQARERVGMRVTDEAQLQYLFDAVWSRGRFDPASIPYQGSGLISTGATPPVPFKAWRLEPNRIDAAAVALAHLRPALDPVSVELADTVVRQVRAEKTGEWVEQRITDVYAQRWERTLPLMFPQPGASPVPARVEAAGNGGTVTIARPETTTQQEDAVNLDESARDMERAAERARQAREAAEAELADAATDPQIDWSVAEGWLEEAVSDGEPPRVAPRPRMRQIVQEHRRDGVGPRVVWQQLQAEGYPTAEQTVIGWMRADAQSGILAQPGGDRSPYVPGPNFPPEQP